MALYVFYGALFVLGSITLWGVLCLVCAFWTWHVREARRLTGHGQRIRGKLMCDGCSRPIHIWQSATTPTWSINGVLLQYNLHTECSEAWYIRYERRFDALDHIMHHSM